jgi:regulator of nonsense transcripts 1
VGDAKQLPPTVTSVDAQRAGLGVSLFERMEKLGVAVDLLDRQYRMHPVLAEFPSKTFYGGRVASHPAPADRPPPPGMRWVRETKRGGIPTATYPVLFVEVDGGREVREKDGLSISNPREALLAVAVADALLRASRDENKNAGNGFENESAVLASASDVGIIAPYAAQVRRVRELWTERTRDAAFERDESSGDRKKNPTEAPELEVHSVDGFQGREKEIIVLCTTRANESSNLGFVRDDRRMNVAMTRAKRGLIVLGNRATLASDPTWRAWLRWIDARGLATTSSDLFGGDEN